MSFRTPFFVVRNLLNDQWLKISQQKTLRNDTQLLLCSGFARLGGAELIYQPQTELWNISNNYQGHNKNCQEWERRTVKLDNRLVKPET